jgi:tetrapyrrole methylase family protein/MazG family protein
MREEFGDLLLQIVLHAQIAGEYGEFSMADVLESIHTKIVYRHPHVFGDLDLKDAQDVLNNWERLKEAERNATGKEEKGLLDGVALALPALVQAQEYQGRAGRVGFDWPDIQGVIDKLDEELKEVNAAQKPEERAGEIGDLLFAVVNLARWFDVDAESALREANARFASAFSHRSGRAQGRSISDLSLDEMEALWQRRRKRYPYSPIPVGGRIRIECPHRPIYAVSSSAQMLSDIASRPATPLLSSVLSREAACAISRREGHSAKIACRDRSSSPGRAPRPRIARS